MPATELRLRNDLYCVEWGVKLYSLELATDHCEFLTATLTLRQTSANLNAVAF